MKETKKFSTDFLNEIYVTDYNGFEAIYVTDYNGFKAIFKNFAKILYVCWSDFCLISKRLIFAILKLLFTRYSIFFSFWEHF